MTCNDVQKTLLHAFEDRSHGRANADIVAHIAQRPECTRFQAQQIALDARSCSVEPTPAPSADFRRRLRQDIGRAKARQWSAAMPTIVHYAACSVATIVCAAILPFEASMTIGVGAAATITTHFLVGSLQDLLDRADGNV